MNIGVVVYSRSGNTLSVTEKLKERLSAAGHSVKLEQVAVAGGGKPGERRLELGTLPDLAGYDGVVFGAAVEAFSLSSVMSAYLKRVGSLEGKKVAFLVTEGFPYPWMGGNRAVSQMKKLCRAKGAEIVGSAVVNWAKSRREKTTAAALDRLTGLF